MGDGLTGAGRRGRRGRHHRDGAPLQHRAVAAADRAHGRDAAVVRADRRRSARPVRTSTTLITERTKVVSLTWVSNMLGTDQPGRRDRRPGPRRSARSSWSTPRRRCRRCRSTSSPAAPTSLVFTGHKVVGPDRHRRALGPSRGARAAAAVPRRRRDDRDRHDGAVDLRRHPAQVRGRHPADRRGRRASARRSTTSATSGMDAIHAHEQAITGYALEGLADRARR